MSHQAFKIVLNLATLTAVIFACMGSLVVGYSAGYREGYYDGCTRFIRSLSAPTIPWGPRHQYKLGR